MKGHGARPTDGRTISHFMKSALVAALIRQQHGDAKARLIALREQRKARRARSRRRFAFWGDVAARIDTGTYDTGVQ